MLSTKRKYEVLGPKETENLILYTLYKLGESDYLELSNITYVLDALLTKQERKRLPFLRGSISNERGVIMRSLADTIECLSIEKKVRSLMMKPTVYEVYRLRPEVEKAVEEVQKRVKKMISSKSFNLYMKILNDLVSIKDPQRRFEKSVEYALAVYSQEEEFFRSLESSLKSI